MDLTMQINEVLQQRKSYIDNDNVVLLSKTNNDNDIVRAKDVDRIANLLVEKFNSPRSREFYCLVAWKLSESQIWCNYEKSQGKNCPAAYFNKICRVQF